MDSGLALPSLAETVKESTQLTEAS
jgi:hypothetical protein